MLDEAEVKLSD